MPVLTIDDKRVEAPEGRYLLEAATKAGIRIPTLCHHEALEPYGACRLCMVEITRAEWDGWSRLVVSCIYPVQDGLIVKTASERVLEARRVVLDLLLARCPETPLIARLAAEYGIQATSYRRNPKPTDCILCGLCTRICDHIGTSAIASSNRGVGREIAPPFGEAPPACIGCLSCAGICPTGFIKVEEDGLKRTIWKKEFEMLACSRCGRSHVTKAQAGFFTMRKGIPETYFATCDECKRADQAALYGTFLDKP